MVQLELKDRKLYIGDDDLPSFMLYDMIVHFLTCPLLGLASFVYFKTMRENDSR